VSQRRCEGEFVELAVVVVSDDDFIAWEGELADEA
jgi:hypothetical protein